MRKKKAKKQQLGIPLFSEMDAAHKEDKQSGRQVQALESAK
jgi:hypothetical protein